MRDDVRTVPISGNFPLRLLLEQTNDLEEAVFGCYKTAIFDCDECSRWNFLSKETADGYRHEVNNQAFQEELPEELLADKSVLLELAKERGVGDEYVKHCLSAAGFSIHSMKDYSSGAELQFGLFLWRANLSQDLGIVDDSGRVDLVCKRWRQCMRMMYRCVCESLKYYGGMGNGEDAAMKMGIKQGLEMLVKELEVHGMDVGKVLMAVRAANERFVEGDEEAEEEEEEEGQAAAVKKARDKDWYKIPVKEMYGSSSE